MENSLLPPDGRFPGKEEYLSRIAVLEGQLGRPIQRVCYRWEQGMGSVKVYHTLLCTPFTGQENREMLRPVVGEAPCYDYLLYLPKDYQPGSEKKWPVIWFFHGIGQRGRDVWEVARHGVCKYLAEGNSLDAIVIAPQCPRERHWADTDLEVEINLRQFLPRMMERYAIDPEQMYLTGLSMGGRCSWKMALAMPELFAALAPVCGRTECYAFSDLLPMPIYMVHGVEDGVIPFENVGKILPALLEQGHSDISLTVYPHHGHDVWSDTYGWDGFYRWMLKQRRKSSP